MCNRHSSFNFTNHEIRLLLLDLFSFFLNQEQNKKNIPHHIAFFIFLQIYFYPPLARYYHTLAHAPIVVLFFDSRPAGRVAVSRREGSFISGRFKELAGCVYVEQQEIDEGFPRLCTSGAMGCFGSSQDDEAKKLSKKIDADIKQDKIAYRATHRLLLLGKNFVGLG